MARIAIRRRRRAAGSPEQGTGQPLDLRQSLAGGVLRRVLQENLRKQWKYYSIGIVGMILVAATTAGTAWMVQYVIDVMTQPQVGYTAAQVAAGVFFLFVLRGVAGYVQAVAMTRAGTAIVAEQQARLYGKILRQGVAYFQLRGSSDLLVSVTASANAARSVVDILVTTYVRDLLTVVALFGVMVIQQPTLTLGSLVLGPVIFFALRALLRRIRTAMNSEFNSIGEITRVVQETTHGIQVIKLFGLEGHMQGRMHRAVSDVRRRANLISRLSALTGPLMDTVAGSILAGIVLVSAFNAASGDPATAGQLVSFVTALMMVYEPAKRLARTRMSLEAQMYGIVRMYEILDAPDTMTETATPAEGPVETGDIVFEDVHFGYGDAPELIPGLDFTFESGRTTALVGPSGGGKSTLLSLIMRLYDPQGGRILLAGRDLRDLPLAGLRARMAYVGQNTFLFDGTVRENIRVGLRDATDAQIEEAARAAQAHDFIAALPQGYDSPIGENGTLLSGGQRQRLAIARAFLRDAPILLLDEATSALDAISEAQIRDAILRLSAGRTTIVIAHRLSTILKADRICYVERGRIVEHGNLSALLANQGPFRELFDEQFRDVGT